MNENIPAGPGLRKQQLAKTLHGLRVKAGLSYAAVAAELGCVGSRVGHLESGRTTPTKPDVVLLARLYGVPDREAELVTLWEATQDKGWWDLYRFPKWLQIYIGLESSATHVKSWSLELVHGLAQTPEYVRSLYRPGSSADLIERAIKIRMERQKSLGRGQQFTMLCSEGLIRRTACIRDAGPGQLTHLIAISELPNVEFRVIPFSAGLPQSLSSGFTIMRFPANIVNPVVFRDDATNLALSDRVEDVADLENTFAANLTMSLDPDDSVELIRGALQSVNHGTRLSS